MVEEIKRLRGVTTSTLENQIKSIKFTYQMKDGSFFITDTFGKFHAEQDGGEIDEYKFEQTDSVDSIFGGFNRGLKFFKISTAFNKVYAFGDTSFDLRTNVKEIKIGNRKLKYISGGLNGKSFLLVF